MGRDKENDILVSFPRIVGHNDEGIVERDRKKYPDEDPRAPRVYVMGKWWIESACNGLCDRVPFVSRVKIEGV